MEKKQDLEGHPRQASSADGLAAMTDRRNAHYEIILYDKIVACIWLLKIHTDKEKLLQLLCFQNPRISLNNWLVV